MKTALFATLVIYLTLTCITWASLCAPTKPLSFLSLALWRDARRVVARVSKAGRMHIFTGDRSSDLEKFSHGVLSAVDFVCVCVKGGLRHMC